MIRNNHPDQLCEGLEREGLGLWTILTVVARPIPASQSNPIQLRFYSEFLRKNLAVEVSAAEKGNTFTTNSDVGNPEVVILWASLGESIIDFSYAEWQVRHRNPRINLNSLIVHVLWKNCCIIIVAMRKLKLVINSVHRNIYLYRSSLSLWHIKVTLISALPKKSKLNRKRQLGEEKNKGYLENNGQCYH